MTLRPAATASATTGLMTWLTSTHTLSHLSNGRGCNFKLNRAEKHMILIFLTYKKVHSIELAQVRSARNRVIGKEARRTGSDGILRQNSSLASFRQPIETNGNRQQLQRVEPRGTRPWGLSCRPSGFTDLSNQHCDAPPILDRLVRGKGTPIGLARISSDVYLQPAVLQRMKQAI